MEKIRRFLYNNKNQIKKITGIIIVWLIRKTAAKYSGKKRLGKEKK